MITNAVRGMRLQHGYDDDAYTEERVREVRPQPVEGRHFEGQAEDAGHRAVGGRREALAKYL